MLSDAALAPCVGQPVIVNGVILAEVARITPTELILKADGCELVIDRARVSSVAPVAPLPPDPQRSPALP